MKKTLLTLCIVGVAASAAFAQGRIAFTSASPAAQTRFQTPLDSPLGQKFVSGTNATFRADLFFTLGSSTVGVTAEQLVQSGGFNQLFQTGAAAGYFAGGTKTLSTAAGSSVNIDGGTSIVAQVRVWDTAFGSFAAAQTALGAHWGVSQLFTITPVNSPTTPPNLPLGIQTITLTYNPVPEPSSMALAGLGAAALLVFRRRK